MILRLLERADVLMENFRPGTMERLGLGYEQVRAIRPDIIYASATGFGSTGPMAARPGQDLLIQAYSGLIASTGHLHERPVPIGFAAADQHGGALLAMGILGAYVKKLRTGQRHPRRGEPPERRPRSPDRAAHALLLRAASIARNSAATATSPPGSTRRPMASIAAPIAGWPSR